MTDNIDRAAIEDLLREVARDAIDHYEIPHSYDPVDYAAFTEQLIKLIRPEDPNGDAVQWRQQVADGLGYMIPETGQIADADTVIAAAKGWERDSHDLHELTQDSTFTPPF